MFDEATYKKRWREKNRDRILARRREIRDLNREKLNRQGRELYWKDAEKSRAKGRAQYAAKPEAINARKRAWNKANPEKVRAQRNRWGAKNKPKLAAYAARLRRDHPERALLNRARSRAKKLGLPFDLTVSDVVIPRLCPVLGIQMVVGHGAKMHTPASPTIDRIVPELGYVRGNIAIISFRANSLKSDANVEELRCVYEYAKKYTAVTLWRLAA